MEPDVRKQLEAAGWKTGGVQEFLGPSDEEMVFIVLKLDSGKAAQTKRRDTIAK
jgi:hypothetical protein